MRGAALWSLLLVRVDQSSLHFSRVFELMTVVIVVALGVDALLAAVVCHLPANLGEDGRLPKVRHHLGQVPHFKDDTLASVLQRFHRLLVRRLAQADLIDGDDGVADEELPGGVRRQAAEDLRDENGHAILSAALDADAQAIAGSLSANGHQATAAAGAVVVVVVAKRQILLHQDDFGRRHLEVIFTVAADAARTSEALQRLIERQLEAVAVQFGVHPVPARLGKNLEAAASLVADAAAKTAAAVVC